MNSEGPSRQNLENVKYEFDSKSTNLNSNSNETRLRGYLSSLGSSESQNLYNSQNLEVVSKNLDSGSSKNQERGIPTLEASENSGVNSDIPNEGLEASKKIQKGPTPLLISLAPPLPPNHLCYGFNIPPPPRGHRKKSGFRRKPFSFFLFIFFQEISTIFNKLIFPRYFHSLSSLFTLHSFCFPLLLPFSRLLKP